ncbi:MAG: hypothetical protein Q9188_007387, partial [Gyalolechia gomerana]
TNTPILLLPIAISVEEEVRALRELADEDPERYEGEYVDFVRGLREKEYRELNGGFVGAVLDEFDRDDETRRMAGGGREIDENYDDSTSSSDYIEGGDEQNGQGGQKEGGMHNEPEEPNEPEDQNETDDPEKQSEQHKKGYVGQPSKSPVKPLSSSPPPPPPSPSPPPSTSENQPTDVESDSSHTPIPGKETFESKHPLYKPMPYDAPEGMTLRGPLQPGDEKRLGLNMAEFIRSHHGYEEGWVGRKFLGQGAAGRAGMWEKRDADRNVVDRVCIKQTQEPTFSEYKWDKPFEVEVMEDLQDPANNGTVQLRGQYIPEEFIWDAFYHLANACRAMDRGPSRPEDKRRDIYIHRDIKPDNIFLAAPGGYNEDCIPIYPTTKLGDFGLAKATGLEDPLNPSAYKGRGTIGYRPPEQKVPAHIQKDYSKEYQDEFVYGEITNDEPKFSSESNVWGVGACIYKFIWLTDASYDFHDKMKENEEVIPKIETTRTPEYSQELRDLVHECLNFSPLKRPTLSTLIDRVGQARARFREQWKETRKVPSESLLYYTDEAVEKMDFGTWVKRRHVHEDPPPTSYSYLSDPSLDEEVWDRITDLINDF